MAEHKKRDGEDFNSLLKKFKRKVKAEGTLQEFRDREFFEKKSETKQKDLKAAQRRTRQQQRDDEY